MVEHGKTVLKTTPVNFGKRPRRNLYSAYSKGQAQRCPSVCSYVGMRRNLYNFRYQASADARYRGEDAFRPGFSNMLGSN